MDVKAIYDVIRVNLRFVIGFQLNDRGMGHHAPHSDQGRHLWWCYITKEAEVKEEESEENESTTTTDKNSDSDELPNDSVIANTD